jgi:hypothetical protein
MGWTFCRDWHSKRDVLDHWKDENERTGYSVQMSGSWVYVEKDRKPVDLIFILTASDDGEWGYKEQSVTLGPLHYNAPLWMVLKVHSIFKDDQYYKGWLAKYPKRKSVYESIAQGGTASLFEGVA